MQWLPLRFPGNVRVIVTATNPHANDLGLHEWRIQQHVPASTPSTNGLTSPGAVSARRNQRKAGESDAKCESSHRRRKVGRILDVALHEVTVFLRLMFFRETVATDTSSNVKPRERTRGVIRFLPGATFVVTVKYIEY